ncbi:hypothetical protein PGT21_021935 [Puccinia graminis f. sp. tritici]|uniref:Uncharacterized protein n=1 Tax=Puccinia graminis f. sp. tritici TaxID=56615 RepID=A0A5B0MPI8_PUCGR|nr:hypothetical protein PGT21_021935 [Puccinia graminis f. sp. tritici]
MMRASRINFWLGAASQVLGCLGGLIIEPPTIEVLNNVHASLSLDPPKWSKKTQKKSSEVYINHISQKLNRLSCSKANDEGPDRLAWMIVRDLSDIFHSGRIEFEKAWDKYMVKDRFSRKNSNLPNILPEEEEILGTLYNWLKGGRHGWSKYQRDLTQQWAVSRVRKLKEFKMTKGTVRVAVDFHTFAMAWHCSRVYDSIAYALAISRSCHWQPRGFEDHSIIEVIKKTPMWRKSDNCATSEEYLKVLMAMENPHSAPPLEISPKLGQYDVDSCYLDILNKFNHLSQILNLSFIHEDSQYLFWKCLDSATDDEDLKFLMEAFQDFCSYFWRGNPFDNSFKYHQLVFRIGSKVRNYLGIKTEKLSGSNIERSGKTMSTKQSKTSEKTVIEEIESFYCKTRLVMRYVEEFSQTVKQKGFISVFHPKPRASLAQLRHLAFLISDHMSPLYSLDFNEEAVVYNINKQLEIHEFPASIQHSMLGIMGNKHYSFENLKESLLPSIREAGQTQLEAVETFYENLEFLVSKMKNKSTPLSEETKKDYSYVIQTKLKELYQLILKKFSHNEFQNNTVVWEQVFLAVKQELSSSSSENADKLIKVLKHGHLIRRNIPVLHHIYYIMTQTNEKEKKIIFGVMNHKLNSLEAEMTPIEFERLSEISFLVQALSKETTYSVWSKTLLGKLSILPHDLAMNFDEILFDSSRSILARKIDHLFKFHRIQNVLEGVEELLSEESKTTLKKITNFLSFQRVDCDIMIMAQGLMKGLITDFSSSYPGDLYMNCMKI